jgi:hypothetical protein
MKIKTIILFPVSTNSLCVALSGWQKKKIQNGNFSKANWGALAKPVSLIRGERIFALCSPMFVIIIILGRAALTRSTPAQLLIT